jgi:glycosyltransferase involved in cell wall biosynthesis
MLSREPAATKTLRKRTDSGRVLLVITTLTLGGAETQVVRLAIELKKNGWVVAVTCLVPPTAYVDSLNATGIPVHSLGMQRGVPDPRAIWRLRSLIRDFSPDVVHSHMVHANLLCRVARLISGFPVLICTAHNLRETSERGGPTWHKELLYRSTDFLADTTTIICKAAFERYLRVGAVPAGKLRVIHNGVDTQYYSPSIERRTVARRSLHVGDQFVWLAVGRLVHQKDYPNLLRALTLIQNERWLLLIAGNGPLAGELQAQCAQLGLTERVRFLGGREDIVDLYHAADAFVMSSRFEGLSAALLEAASMGLPSVVTNVGGNPDVVIDGDTGYIVEPENPDAIANAMHSIMRAQPEERRAFSVASRRRCLDHFQFEAIARKWLDLYEHYLPPERTRVVRPARMSNSVN